MSDSKDVLEGDLSLEASLDATGVKAKARSRILVSIDRLIGNIIDIPSAYVEGKARRIRFGNSAQEALMEADLKAAIESLRQSSDAGRRILQSYLGDQARKHDNRNAVAYEAIEALKQLPPSSGPEIEDTEEHPISDDWLNVFSAHAENASSEQLRSLWGRILAGEAKKPGSFSMTTLRVIAEIDKEVAEIFEKVIPTRIDEYAIIKPKDLSGVTLIEFNLLEEFGLLSNAVGFVHRNIEKNNDGLFYIFRNEDRSKFLLKIKSSKERIQIPCITITRTGKEIMSILPPAAEDATLRLIASSIKEQSETIELCRIIDRNQDGLMSFTIIENL